MLRVTYTGGDSRQRWLFDPDDVDMDEAERMERALGDDSTATWDNLIDGLLNGKVRPRKVVFWHLLRRTNPDYDLPFSETPTPKMGELTVELGTTEVLKMIAQVEAAPGRSPVRKQALLDRLYLEYGEAEAAEKEIAAGDVTADPKAETADGTSAEAGTPDSDGDHGDHSAIGG